jgi:serine/threonine-protein kinase RsbW
VEDRLRLTLRSSLAEIDRLSQEFTQFATQHNLSAQVRFVMNLALEEVATNVIKYAYQGRDDQVFAVEVWIDPTELVASVEDSGPAFNPLNLPPPEVSAPLEDRQPGGLGIHLARHMLDHLEYSRFEGKNRLVLRKGL